MVQGISGIPVIKVELRVTWEDDSVTYSSRYIDPAHLRNNGIKNAQLLYDRTVNRLREEVWTEPSTRRRLGH